MQKKPDVFPLRVLYWSTPDIAEIFDAQPKAAGVKKPHSNGSGQAAALSLSLAFLRRGGRVEGRAHRGKDGCCRGFPKMFDPVAGLVFSH